MSSVRVRCEDCAEYKGERCEVKMKYMSPKVRRWCLHFKARTQVQLEPWAHSHHTWPP